MKIKTIRKVKNLAGKKVLLRADFNVPIKNRKVADEFKIVRAIPTIRFLLRHNCKIILMTHLGRPKAGKVNSSHSLKPVVKRLSEIFDKKIQLTQDCTSLKTGTTIGKMKNKDIVVLENLRFEKGEKENSSAFAKQLAKLADIYVNDAFANSHRAHASMAAIKKYLPSYAGLLLEREVLNLEKIKRPKKPLVVIIGGVKVVTKISLLKKFSSIAHRILIGGALANSFLTRHGYQVGKSFVDQKSVAFAKKFKAKNLILPVDAIVSAANGEAVLKKINQVADDEYIFDIGPETIRIFSQFIKKASTIIWNGPMGKYELDEFRHGSLSVARLVASRSSSQAFGAVGGGETVDVLKMTKMSEHVDWISTGGGAMLSFLGNDKMPGLKGVIG